MASLLTAAGATHAGGRPRASAAGAADLAAVRDVLVVASSSRSGSSLLVRLLSRASCFLHLPGEINPLLRLAGLAWPDSGTDSDALSPLHATGAARRALAGHLAREFGEPTGSRPDAECEEYCDQLQRRLTWQWPGERFTRRGVVRCHERAAAEVRTDGLATFAPLERYFAFFLRHLRAAHPVVNPYYYDLKPDLVRQVFPSLAVPIGPPSKRTRIEEPPFILPEPWRRPADWTRRVLVIKTPSNCYRLAFLRALFPDARFRVLHLTRNPAAAINGLLDGWHHRGFHAHYVGPVLRIRGYAEGAHPDRGWWKFDLAPGWRDYAQQSLELVCAFQWSAAHHAVLTFLRQSGVEHHRLRFESLVASRAHRRRVLAELCEWCGVRADRALMVAASAPLPWTMTVKPPRRARWREKLDRLTPVLEAEPVRTVAAMLDYGDRAQWT